MSVLMNFSNIIIENLFIFSIIAISIWVYQFTGKITIEIIKFIVNIIINILQKFRIYYYENIRQCNKYLTEILYVILGFCIFKLYEFYVNYYKTKYYYYC